MGNTQVSLEDVRIDSTLGSQAVRDQLNRMLVHPLFSRSKRYPPFLRYIVENSLSGDLQHIKERTLGSEVLGRKPDYDTSLDPVVRITAGEIRQRIAQYYHEAGHEFEIRIDLPPGSYLPEFHVPEGIRETPQSRLEVTPSKAHINLRLVTAALTTVGVAMAVLMLGFGARQNILDEFWNPVLTQTSSLLITVAGCSPRRSQAAPNAVATQRSSSPISNIQARIEPTEAAPRPCSMSGLPFSDALALSRIAEIPQSKGHPYEVK